MKFASNNRWLTLVSDCSPKWHRIPFFSASLPSSRSLFLFALSLTSAVCQHLCFLSSSPAVNLSRWSLFLAVCPPGFSPFQKPHSLSFSFAQNPAATPSSSFLFCRPLCLLLFLISLSQSFPYAAVTLWFPLYSLLPFSFYTGIITLKLQSFLLFLQNKGCPSPLLQAAKKCSLHATALFSSFF